MVLVGSCARPRYCKGAPCPCAQADKGTQDSHTLKAGGA